MSAIKQYTEERHEFGADRPVPAPGVIQVIYLDGTVYAVDFLCPCGCGHTCFTPVVGVHHNRAARRPCWDYSPGPELRPSIRFLGGCKAHFNIEKGGRVLMHADSGK